MIARQYGVKLEALMAANPGLDARRLRIGQALTIPVP
jgi:LysM repeat protein